MNKLIVVNNILETKEISESLSIDWKESLSELTIRVCDSTNLSIEIQSDIETKLKIKVDIQPDVTCEIETINQGAKSELEIEYTIRKNSQLSLVKFIDVDTAKYQETVRLEEEGATVYSILKTACTNKENYHLQVFHKMKNTSSNIINHGINLGNGILTFDVSTYIKEGIKGCTANQANRIINLTNQECIIKPNLFIEEYDVIANHSAHIGSLKEEEVFYLERLGIPYEKACNLLLQGFMKSFVREETITKIFEKYWR